MSATVCRVASVALSGLQGTTVLVEAAVSSQLPGMAIIGLPDTALAEAKQRVRVATQHTGLALSDRFIVINLSPAALPKQGSGFDLAIALSALAASGHLPAQHLSDTAHLGELSLDGELRRPPGLLSSVLAAKELGFSRVMVPASGAREAALVPDIEVLAAHHLSDAVAWHRREEAGWWVVGHHEAEDATAAESGLAPDMAEVIGQSEAVEAMTVAAAGRHNVSMTGPPGAGKTLLAMRLPSILPDLNPEESLLASSIASLDGKGLSELVRRPPFESPHHTATKVSIIGAAEGGVVRPGAISRASFGVLFLDEAPEFPPAVLDSLRQPLESGHIAIHRARLHAVLPARVQLVLAANPCPCGYAASTEPALLCRCSPSVRARYQNRLSGPLSDRVDLRLTVRRVSAVMADIELSPRPSSAELRGRVTGAREAMAERLAGTPWTVNADVPGSWFREPGVRLPRHVTTVLDQAHNRGLLTMRGVDRILRLSWTIADLAGKTSPGRDEVAQALTLREGVQP